MRVKRGRGQSITFLVITLLSKKWVLKIGFLKVQN